MKLPEITNLEKLSDGVRLHLLLSPELEAFDGHFDNMPIIPGVVQISWVITFAMKYIPDLPELNVNAIEKLKFQHVMQPEMTIVLELKKSEGNIIFLYNSKNNKHSSGKIVTKR